MISPVVDPIRAPLMLQQEEDVLSMSECFEANHHSWRSDEATNVVVDVGVDGDWTWCHIVVVECVDSDVVRSSIEPKMKAPKSNVSNERR